MSEALGVALVVPKSVAEEALAQIQPDFGSGTYTGLSKTWMFLFRSSGKFIGTCRSAVFEAAQGSHLVWRIKHSQPQSLAGSNPLHLFCRSSLLP